MDLEEYSKSKNMQVIKRIIGNTFVLGCKNNGDCNKDPPNNNRGQSKPHPRKPPIRDDNNIKDKPQLPIGDKPCVNHVLSLN